MQTPNICQKYSMIFKTFDSESDKWSSKIGIFGKSFDVIGNRFKKVMNEIIVTNDFTIANIKNAWENTSFKEDLSDKFIITQKDIEPKLLDIKAYDGFDDNKASKVLQKLQAQKEWVDDNKGSWDSFYKTLEQHEKWQEEFIKNTNLQEASTQDVIKAQKAARESAIAYNNGLKQMTLGAKAANVAMKALSVAGNMLAGMAISWVISKGLEWIYNLATETERVKESAEEYISTLKEAHKSEIENTSTIASLNKEYQTLSKGVNNLGENVSLTTDEYSHYNEICNKVAEIMPNLVQGYDEQGNAILKVKGKLSDLNAEYDNYKRKQAVKNYNKDKVDDVFANFKNADATAANSYTSNQNYLNSLKSIYDGSKTSDELWNKYSELTDRRYQSMMFNSKAGYGETKSIVKELREEEVAFINAIENNLDDLSESAFKDKFNQLQQSAKEDYEKTKGILEAGDIGIQEVMLDKATRTEDYYNLDTDQNKYFQSIINNLNHGFIKDNINTEDEANEFVTNLIDNILTNKDSINEAFSELFTIDLDTTALTPQEIKDKVDKLIEQIAKIIKPDATDSDISNLKITLGFDTVDINAAQFEANINKFSTKTDGKIDEKRKKDISDWVKKYKVTNAELEKLSTEKINGTDLPKYTFSTSINEITNALLKYREESNKLNMKSFSQAWKDLDTTSSESLKNLKSSLLSLAESGNLTEETFKATEGSSTFLDQINESAEEAIKKINELADDSKQLNSLKNGIGLIQKAYVAKRDNGAAGADSLSGMEGTFGDLKSWKKYKETLGSATSSLNDCKTAQNKLATEWVNSSNFLSNLVDETGKVDEATKQYYIDQLKELGIKNAKEVVDAQIANATRTQTDAYAALSDEQKKTVKSAYDLKQMTGEEIIALFGLADGSRNAKIALAELAWENTNWEDLSAQDTIDQLSKIAEMAGIAADKLAGLNALKSDLANSGNGNGDSSYQSMLRATDGKYAANEVKNKLNTKTDVKTDLKFNLDTSNLGGSGSNSGKSDTKKEFDWIEILLANRKKNTDDISKKIDDYQKQGTKNNLYKRLQRSLDDEIKANEKAKNYYLKKAGKVKLSDSLKKKIRNGAIDISTLKGTVAENAEKYQTLYDKAQNAKETAKDLRLRKRDEKRNALDSKIENKNNALGVLKSTAEDLQSEIDLLETKGYSANAEHYKKLDKNAEKQRKNLKEQNTELRKYLDANNIKKYSKEWYDVQKQMEENNQSVNDLTKSQVEWNNTVSEMPFNNLEKMHSLLTSIYDRYQKILVLRKAQGKNKTQEQIKKQLFMSLDDLPLLREEYSEKWKEIYKVLDDKKLSESAKDKFRKIYESFQNGDISKKSFYSQIAELGISKDVFDSWDKLQEKLTDLNDKSGEILDTQTSVEETYDELFDNFSNAIQDLIDKLNEVNEAKSKAIELEKLQQALQNAKQNKTSFIYHEGYGFNYEADRESVNDAQNNLDDFYNQEQLDALNKILDWLEKNKDNFNFFDDNGNPIYATLDEAIEKAVNEMGLAGADFVKGLSWTTDSQGQMKASIEPRVYKTNDNVNDKLDKVLETKTSVEGIYDKLKPLPNSGLLSKFNPNLVPYEPDAKWAKLLENTAPLLTPQMNLQTPDFSKLVMKNDTSNNDYSVNIEKVEVQANDAQSLINELSNLSSAALQRAHRNR